MNISVSLDVRGGGKSFGSLAKKAARRESEREESFTNNIRFKTITTTIYIIHLLLICAIFFVAAQTI
jgi:hypothetical protein